MPPKKNPLRLNSLQLKTLTILQELARSPETSTRSEETGDVLISSFPSAHGDHYHVGDALVRAKDASGLRNEAVWKALERRALARSLYPIAISLTGPGLAYDTGLADEILIRPSAG